jgi:hypothetical protein
MNFKACVRGGSSGEVSEQSGIGADKTMEHPWEQPLPADDGFGGLDVRPLEMAREIWRHRVMAICQVPLKTLHPHCRRGVARVEAVSAGVVERGSRAFDRRFACAKQQVQAEVLLGRPWKFEAVLTAVWLAHEKRLDQIQMRLEAVSAEKHRHKPHADRPDCRGMRITRCGAIATFASRPAESMRDYRCLAC